MVPKSVLSVIIMNAMLSGIAVVLDKKSTIGSKSGVLSLAFFSQVVQAIMVVILIVFITRNTVWKDLDLKKSEYKWITWSSLLYAIPLVTFYWVYSKGEAHVINLFVVGFGTLFGVLMPALFLKEKVLTETWIGMSVVLAGLLLINYYHGRYDTKNGAFVHAR